MSNIVKINNSVSFEYRNSEKYHDRWIIVLNTDDIRAVMNAFQSIDVVEIFRDDNLIDVDKIWETYSDIGVVTEGNDIYVKVTLKQADLKLQIKRLNSQLNPTYNPEAMDTESLRDYVLMITSQQCRETIYNGLDIQLSTGTEHFTFNADDQQNLKELCDIVLQTQVDMPYHKNGDNNNCKVYAWRDIVTIYATLSAHKLYHTTYQNAVNNYIPTVDREVLMQFKYGDKLPDDVMAHINDMVAQSQKAINALLGKAGFEVAE